MSTPYPTRGRRRTENGQGLIEGAGALICCLLVIFACVSLSALTIGQFEVDSASADATAATLAAPLGAEDQSKQLATYAFVRSLATHSWIEPDSVECTSANYFQGRDVPGSKITCTGKARLRLSMLPIPGGIDLPLHDTETVGQPGLRQCGTVTNSQVSSGC